MNPLSPSVRRHNNYLSVLLDLTVEAAALGIEAFVASPLGRHTGIQWREPLPNEAPAGIRYWPRLTVAGTAPILGKGIPIEIEVWPWDRGSTELGLRPVLTSRPPAGFENVWFRFAEGTLREARTLVLHPSVRRTLVASCGPI